MMLCVTACSCGPVDVQEVGDVDTLEDCLSGRHVLDRRGAASAVDCSLLPDAARTPGASSRRCETWSLISINLHLSLIEACFVLVRLAAESVAGLVGDTCGICVGGPTSMVHSASYEASFCRWRCEIPFLVQSPDNRADMRHIVDSYKGEHRI
jgi:hypothetical protein